MQRGMPETRRKEKGERVRFEKKCLYVKACCRLSGLYVGEKHTKQVNSTDLKTLREMVDGLLLVMMKMRSLGSVFNG